MRCITFARVRTPVNEHAFVCVCMHVHVVCVCVCVFVCARACVKRVEKVYAYASLLWELALWTTRAGRVLRWRVFIGER